MKMRAISKAFWLAVVLIPLIAIGAAWAALQAVNPATARPLASMVPQGALLTIEAKDFGSLLKQWNSSTEKAAWLKSDNYGAFSRSRLFERLNAAQGEFAGVAGLAPDMSFLKEVAGHESIFAWYDIGNLEFVYITHMPAGSASQSRLLQSRETFSPRKANGQTFYVRTAEETHRTVAFATSGDWLILSTREDLMASALDLIAKANTSNSIENENWFSDARSAATRDAGDLRMTLNLEKIVRTPYFRTYWVQRNITEMKQYRSAVTDMYEEPSDFREERVLLPKAVGSGSDDTAAGLDLGELTRLVPAHAGVYRAVAAPGIDFAITTLNDHLLAMNPSTYNDQRLAPQVDLTVGEAGSDSDFETRIDTAPLIRQPKGSELQALRKTLETSGLKAMMTVNRTGEAHDGIWVPFQSAVVLWSETGVNAEQMQAGLKEALRSRLTAGGIGLEWKPIKNKSVTYSEISDTRPLQMAVHGNFCVISDDSTLMADLLSHMSNGKADGARPQPAIVVAGFDPTLERRSFERWTALVDRTSHGGDGSSVSIGGQQPAFFSQDMRGLSDSFDALDSEYLVERRDGPLTRQTVTYTWRK